MKSESRQAEEKKPAGIDQWSFKHVKVKNAAGTGSEFDGTDSDEKKFIASSLCAMIILLISYCFSRSGTCGWFILINIEVLQQCAHSGS
ncbi:unnamed protein product [Prunus armeniaca]|uniref:Uncharacterized protein n=1 Tax=Prunus armeniaca TaxID=36596 RepID=A0A6J5Y5F3_PRUAR|nr:unnamed protein product [Prunus armeniaca]